MEAVESRNCLACKKTLRGRSDKKYCDDYCRNHYNNHLKAKSGYSPAVRNINNALLNNRKVLCSVLAEGEETVRMNREELLVRGFRFKYITHTYITRTGREYYYCYDYGYLPLDNDRFLIVRSKEQ